MRPRSIVIALIVGLGATEGLAYWWMHPAPAGAGEPVLVYQPTERRIGDRGSGIGDDKSKIEDQGTGDRGQGTGDRGQGTGDRGQRSEARGQTEQEPSSSSHPQPSGARQPERSGDGRRQTAEGSPEGEAGGPRQSTIHNPQSSISPSSLTPLPEIYAKAAPMLRCSSGQVFHVDLDEEIGLHLAFFEWDGTDTGSVLDAFLHMPESCLGSIGMTLVAKERPITYQIDGVPLLFDHTVLRDRGQARNGIASAPLVHSYRAIWVSGMTNLNSRGGLGVDDSERMRIIRMQSALTRYRPAHARVIQGAVRGAANAETAWQAFEQAMLVDLKFESM